MNVTNRLKLHNLQSIKIDCSEKRKIVPIDPSQHHPELPKKSLSYGECKDWLDSLITSKVPLESIQDQFKSNTGLEFLSFVKYEGQNYIYCFDGQFYMLYSIIECPDGTSDKVQFNFVYYANKI